MQYNTQAITQTTKQPKQKSDNKIKKNTNNEPNKPTRHTRVYTQMDRQHKTTHVSHHTNVYANRKHVTQIPR